MIAVVDSRMPQKAKEELSVHFPVVELPPFSKLDKRVASHPDMLIFTLENKLFTSQSYYNEAKKEINKIIALSKKELLLTDDEFSNTYPCDIGFNAFIFNGRLIGKTESLSKSLKTHAEGMGLSPFKVKQGYAKCSTVVLDNGVISADAGICRAISEIGGEALQISPNGISLNGYNCGFLGGASGVCGKKVYFCGNIKNHPDFAAIDDFSKKLGYEIISLSGGRLYDVGSILFI